MLKEPQTQKMVKQIKTKSKKNWKKIIWFGEKGIERTRDERKGQKRREKKKKRCIQ